MKSIAILLVLASSTAATAEEKKEVKYIEVLSYSLSYSGPVGSVYDPETGGLTVTTGSEGPASLPASTPHSNVTGGFRVDPGRTEIGTN